MTDEIYELLSTVASNNGLQLVQTTEGTNGYPSHISYAITGFEDMAQLNAVKDYILELYPAFVADADDDVSVSELYLHRRDGWDFWNYTRPPHVEPYSLNDLYDGLEDYCTYEKSTYKDEEDFIKSEVLSMTDCFTSFESFKNYLKEKEEIWNNIKELEDDEMLVCHTDSKVLEVMQRQGMEYYYDTHHYAIALTID